MHSSGILLIGAGGLTVSAMHGMRRRTPPPPPPGADTPGGSPWEDTGQRTGGMHPSMEWGRHPPVDRYFSCVIA